MFPGTFTPWNKSSRELSLPGAKVPGKFYSWERKFPPRSENTREHKSLNLLNSSGLSRKQRGLGRLKLADIAYINRSPLWRSKGQLAGGGTYCGVLPRSLFILTASVGKIVFGANCLWGETSMGRNVYGAKCHSMGRNVHGVKSP